jgi:hypothetical protein
MFLTTPPFARTFLALTKSFTKKGQHRGGPHDCEELLGVSFGAGAHETNQNSVEATPGIFSAPAALDRDELAAGDYRFALDLVDEK